ncbi:MAG: carboxypeptidase regulatory-like domain-containing protein [bacterium]|nr:carboxypeptidase regulatory-like domain-containing protein [bacterium]
MKRSYFIVGLLLGIFSACFTYASGFGTISGKVTSEQTGEPLVGAAVGVFLSPWDTTPVSVGVSEPNGNYRVVFLVQDSGYFYVCCWKIGYRGEWWDNASSPEEADPVLVHSGETVHNIDFGLALVSGNSGVCGRVISEHWNNDFIEGATVTAYLSPEDTVGVGDTVTGQFGSYFLRLAPGRYYIYAEKAGEYEGEWWQEGNPQPVSVKENEITPNINFTLTPIYGSAISGIVRSNAGDIIWGAVVRLYTNPFGEPIDTEISWHNGFYRFTNLEPGTYYLSASAYGFNLEWWDDADTPEEADSVVVMNEEVCDINFYLESSGAGVGAVTGFVKDKETNTPIKWAIVTLSKADMPIAGACTDTSGVYLIRMVPEGSYIAKARAMGYMVETYPESVKVVANELTSDINFLLSRDTLHIPGSISGLVMTEENNIPIPDVFVIAYGSHGVGKGRTDSIGSYKIEPLFPGSYYVKACACGYLPEWYNEASNPIDATLVEVAEGQDVSGINFTLSSFSIGEITGTVVDTAGQGIPFARVLATGINTWYEHWTKADSMGVYSIELIPGFYRVSGYANGYSPGVYPEPVEVIENSITSGIDITLQPVPTGDGKISGVVRDDSTQFPICGAFVLVTSRLTTPHFLGYAFTDTTGAYEVENVPVIDEPVFHVRAFAPGYIPEFYDNVYYWELATLVSSFADSINFELSHASGGPNGISGRITGGDKGGVANAVVYAIDGTKIIGGDYSQKDGYYLLDELPPGTYMLKVSAPGYPTTTYGPVEVLEQNVSDANIQLEVAGISEKQLTEKETLSLKVTPNIVSHLTTLLYNVPNTAHVEVTIYNVSGQKVTTLVNSKEEAGIKQLILNTHTFTQGIYFIRLTVGNNKIVKKLIILR